TAALREKPGVSGDHDVRQRIIAELWRLKWKAAQRDRAIGAAPLAVAAQQRMGDIGLANKQAESRLVPFDPDREWKIAAGQLNFGRTERHPAQPLDPALVRRRRQPQGGEVAQRHQLAHDSATSKASCAGSGCRSSARFAL